MSEGNDPSDFDTLREPEKQALLYWIDHAITRSATFEKRSSYGIKYDFEKEGFYISNGQFKGAMRKLEYEPKDAAELNWLFRIRKKVTRRTYGSQGIIPQESYSLGRFDKEFAALLLAAGHL